MKNKGSAQQIGRAHEYLEAEETVKIPAGKVTLAVATSSINVVTNDNQLRFKSIKPDYVKKAGKI